MLQSLQDTYAMLALRLRSSEWDAPVTPTLGRVRVLGTGIAVSQIVFGYLMAYVTPQPYENIWLRLILAIGALLMVAHSFRPLVPRLSMANAFNFSIWIQLDAFSLWMYFMNGGNSIWLAYTCTSIMMTFLLMKWRLALIGIMASACAAPIWALLMGQPLTSFPLAHSLVLFMAITISLLYALITGSMREQHLRQSLALTNMVQVQIHPTLTQLRRYLAQLEPISRAAQPEASAKRLQKLSLAFGESLAQVEAYLQTQRNNAQLLGHEAQLLEKSLKKEPLSAQDLVHEVVNHYAYAQPSIKRAVSIKVENDFQFLGQHQAWVQALSNLMKNSLDSLTQTKLHLETGDLTFHVQVRKDWGRISVQDHGLPLGSNVLPHVFEPFYSAGPAAGLGLGLPFCQHLVRSSGGRITVHSDAVRGTVFHLYLPITASPGTKAAPPKERRA